MFVLNISLFHQKAGEQRTKKMCCHSTCTNLCRMKGLPFQLLPFTMPETHSCTCSVLLRSSTFPSTRPRKSGWATHGRLEDDRHDDRGWPVAAGVVNLWTDTGWVWMSGSKAPQKEGPVQQYYCIYYYTSRLVCILIRRLTTNGFWSISLLPGVFGPLAILTHTHRHSLLDRRSMTFTSSSMPLCKCTTNPPRRMTAPNVGI